MLFMCGAVVIAPALASMLGSPPAGQTSPSAALRLASPGRSPFTDPATTTVTRRSGRTATATTVPQLEVTPDMVAEPFSAPPEGEAIPPASPAAVAASPPPPPPPPKTRGGRGRSQTGKASWYEIHNGTCAHVTLPKGTMVRVVNVANDKEVTCRVADRGPFLQGRIIDLDLQSFEQIAGRSQGVVDVRISW